MNLNKLDLDAASKMRYEFLVEVGVDNLVNSNPLANLGDLFGGSQMQAVANELKDFVKKYEEEHPDEINLQKAIAASLEGMPQDNSSDDHNCNSPDTNATSPSTSNGELFTPIAHQLFPGRENISGDRAIQFMNTLTANLSPQNQQNFAAVMGTLGSLYYQSEDVD